MTRLKGSMSYSPDTSYDVTNRCTKYIPHVLSSVQVLDYTFLLVFYGHRGQQANSDLIGHFMADLN